MRLLFLTIACFFVFGAYAEGGKEKRKKLPFHPEHELFFGVGVTPLPAVNQEDDVYYGGSSNLVHFEGDTYLGPKYTSGAWYLGYSYRVKRWLNLCFSISYTSYWRHRQEYYTDRKTGVNRQTYVGVVPAVRLTWLNREYVRMYSTLGVGVTFRCGDHEYSEDRDHTAKQIATPEVTLIGISVGKTWYMFAEVGPSHHGAFSGGIGYRFNKNRHRK